MAPNGRRPLYGTGGTFPDSRQDRHARWIEILEGYTCCN